MLPVIKDTSMLNKFEANSEHFDKMSRRYYSFNGMDDVNAKHSFLNSLPEPLGDVFLNLLLPSSVLQESYL